MTIVRLEPFQAETQNPLSRLFSRAFAGPADALSARAWSPAVDVYETDQEVVLKAELPGVDPKDVDVRVEEGTLYLKGERKLEKETKEEGYQRVERCYGSFMRSFPLPAGVDADKATAEYKNGVLTLTLPKREEAKPRTIKIQPSKN
jgi:HSP20 family protein